MARACIDGICLPCATDSECEDREVCVLNNCLLTSNVECRSRDDCEGPDSLCILTGYSTPDLRNNKDMRSICLSPTGGNDPSPEEIEAKLAAELAAAKPSSTGGPTPPAERAYELLRNNLDAAKAAEK